MAKSFSWDLANAETRASWLMMLTMIIVSFSYHQQKWNCDGTSEKEAPNSCKLFSARNSFYLSSSSISLKLFDGNFVHVTVSVISISSADVNSSNTDTRNSSLKLLILLIVGLVGLGATIYANNNAEVSRSCCQKVCRCHGHIRLLLLLVVQQDHLLSFLSNVWATTS